MQVIPNGGYFSLGVGHCDGACCANQCRTCSITHWGASSGRSCPASGCRARAQCHASAMASEQRLFTKWSFWLASSRTGGAGRHRGRAVACRRHQLAQGVDGRHRAPGAGGNPVVNDGSAWAWRIACQPPHRALDGVGRWGVQHQSQQCRVVARPQPVKKGAERAKAGVHQHAPPDFFGRSARPFGGHHGAQRHGKQMKRWQHPLPCQFGAASRHHALHGERAWQGMELAVARQVERHHLGLGQGSLKIARKGTPVGSLPGQSTQQNPGVHGGALNTTRPVHWLGVVRSFPCRAPTGGGCRPHATENRAVQDACAAPAAGGGRSAD